MSDALIGLIGCVALITFTFVWSWTEDYLRRRTRRKYDERMAKYDKWKEKW
jgi:hypothetical protein